MFVSEHLAINQFQTLRMDSYRLPHVCTGSGLYVELRMISSMSGTAV